MSIAPNKPGFTTLLVITRYPWWGFMFGFLSMAIFRLPLWRNDKLSFWRLMGSGKNGTFSLTPDLRQWAILLVARPGQPGQALPAAQYTRQLLGAFVAGWLKIFGRHTKAYLLQPEEGHGLWNGRQVFGPVPKQANFTGPVAVLTRASIKITKLRRFWQHVGPVARQMASAPGFITSYGVGEVPFTKQATFSIWQSKAQMKAFAYQMQQHKEVVAKTRKEKWYSEDLFMRFSIIDEVETIH